LARPCETRGRRPLVKQDYSLGLGLHLPAPMPLICAFWFFVVSCPSWAGEQEKRFLEFPSDTNTTTYDLNTVQVIPPGKFTITGTTINNPDVMKFEIDALLVLKTYCTRADGKYPAPANVFTLGPPDMPVQSIDVASNPANSVKRIAWYYPYKRLAVDWGHDASQTLTILECGSSEREQLLYFRKAMAVITDGIPQKSKFDCKRGLIGFFLDDKEDAFMTFAPKGTRAFQQYQSVCQAVMHEAPYMPPE
jgi:hypothetical protein